MQRGYVKLWRKIEDTGLLQNAEVCAFFMWALIRATHKPHTQLVGKQSVDLLPGQFIFGRKAASLALRTSERKIRTSLQLLEKLQIVTTKATNKFSIVSFVNWDTYQNTDPTNDQQDDQQTTNKRPASDHKQEPKKERTKELKQTALMIIPEWIDSEAWEAYRTFRKKMKAPMTEYAEKLAIGKLGKLYDKGMNPRDVLEQSILNGWKGLFEVKADYQANMSTAEVARKLKEYYRAKESGSRDNGKHIVALPLLGGDTEAGGESEDSGHVGKYNSPL